MGSGARTPTEKRWWILTTMTYTFTALAYFILPLGTRWRDALLGTALFAPDAILNVGILEWCYKSLRSRSFDIFNWTAGFPLDNTLANTENLIGWQVLYSPLRWVGVSTTATYNILLLSSIVLSGIGAMCLARQLGANRYGAWIAGLVFAFVPFHLNHIIHLQTMAICWAPFTLLFLDRFLARESVKDALGLAATFVLAALFGTYFGVFSLLVLPTYVLLAYAFRRHRFRWHTIGMLIVTGLCAGLVLLPVAVPYLRFAVDHGLSHTPGALKDSSVALMDFIKVPSWLAVWSRSRLTANTFSAAFPGLIAMILIGMYVLLRPNRQSGSRLGVILGLLCLVTLLLSLGPALKIRDNSAVRIAGSYIPMPGAIFLAMSAIRVPMRVLLYTYLFASVLCGLGVAALTDRLSERARAPLALLLLLLLIGEYRPQSWLARNSLIVPEPLAVSDAYPFLAGEANRGAVVELPSADVTGYRTPVMTLYTYGSAGHLRRVVAYHGSVRLSAPDSLQEAASRLPDRDAQDRLRSAGVTRLVVHRSLMKPDEAVRVIAALERANYRKLHEGIEAVVFALN